VPCLQDGEWQPVIGRTGRYFPGGASICDYFRVDNGALIEHWGVMDAAGMMQQLTAH
jgi:predicted SnoaL-like aldol condensation-catalyzing enzyme